MPAAPVQTNINITPSVSCYRVFNSSAVSVQIVDFKEVINHNVCNLFTIYVGVIDYNFMV